MTDESDNDTPARPASLHWGRPAPRDEGEMLGFVNVISKKKSDHKLNELKRVIDGVSIILRFSDTPDNKATEYVKEIMLKSLGKKSFSFGTDIKNL